MSMPVSVPRYTVDDLDVFPADGNRYELLDGVLLVTPGSSHRHQIVATRIAGLLLSEVRPRGASRVAAPGALRVPPGTQLQPDVLVYPSRFSTKLSWQEIDEHWLAVEVLSPSSSVYDREFKVRAYHALGVAEVWIVDADARAIEVHRPGIDPYVTTNELHWVAPGSAAMATLDLAEVFAD